MVNRILIIVMLLAFGPTLTAEQHTSADQVKFDQLQQQINALQQELHKLQAHTSSVKATRRRLISRKLKPATRSVPIIQQAPPITPAQAAAFEMMVEDIDQNSPVVEEGRRVKVEPVQMQDQHPMPQEEPSTMQQFSIHQTQQSWEPKGYEQSVQRAKKTYVSEEAAKCAEKIAKYVNKYTLSPRNEYYIYKLESWRKKCKKIQ